MHTIFKPPFPDPMGDIFSIIKQGVKLRPTNKDCDSVPQATSPPSDSHLHLLQQSLRKISRQMRGTSPESDDEDTSNDFDDDF